MSLSPIFNFLQYLFALSNKNGRLILELNQVILNEGVLKNAADDSKIRLNPIATKR